MLNIGMTELLVFGIIALLILGPEKLPEAVRFIGKWYSKIKRTISNVHDDIDRELRLSELRAQMQKEMQKIHALEIKMQNQLNTLEQYKAFEDNPTPFTKNQTFRPYTFIQTQNSYIFIHAHLVFISRSSITTHSNLNHSAIDHLEIKNYKVAV